MFGQSRSFKYKNVIKSSKMFECIDRDDCMAKAKKYLYDYYDAQNKIVNKYRYVSFNVIEVQLSNNMTFITDSKFLSIVENNRIGLKHDKRYDKYYITYIESPKVNKIFANLILPKISKIKSLNGCDFDLREENLKECDNKVIALGESNIDILTIHICHLFY